VIICPARGLEGMRLPADWKKPLTDGRLLVLSPFAATERRVNKLLAAERNRFVTALADEVVFAHISAGGHLDELRRPAASWGMSPRCLDQDDNGKHSASS
jgi:hypothetical protein